MATEQLIVEVSEKGALVVRRNLEGIGQGARQSSGSVQLLQRALGVLASAALIRQFISMSDTFTNLQNRLRTVTDGEAQLSAVTKELLQVSRETRSSFESTAELYARVALSSRELGVSQQQVIQFTKSLNQAIILSGASAQEAQAGVIQLSQGLASGALRGDELRSVLEQLPKVADVIAKEMGVTRGELRELGAEGKITADIVLNAFKNAEAELDEGFAKTIPTVGQAMTILRNKTLELIGGFNQGTGTIQTISQSIITLADNLDNVMVVVDAVADVFIVTFQVVGDLINELTAQMGTVGIEWSDVFSTMGSVVGALVRTVAQVVDKIVGLFLGLVNAIMAAWDDLPQSIASLLVRGFNLWVGIVEKGINGIVAGLNKIGEALGLEPLVEVELAKLNDPFVEAGNDVAEAFMLGFNQTGLTDLVDDVISGIEDRQLQRQDSRAQAERASTGVDLGAAPPKPEGKGEIDEFAQYLDMLRQENDLLKLTAEERVIVAAQLEAEKKLKRDLTDLEKEQIRVATERNVALSELNAIIEQGELTQKEYNTALDQLNQLLADGVINAEQYKNKLGELDSAMADSATGFEALADVGRSVWDNMFSALDTAVQGGKVTFKDFANSVLSDIARIAAQQAVLSIFKGIGGGLGVSLPGLATGGSFTVGGSGGTDSQPVAFMATPGERVDVLTPGQQQAQANNVNVAAPVIKIVNISDPNAALEAMGSTEGEQVVVNIIAKNRETVRQAIS